MSVITPVEGEANLVIRFATLGDLTFLAEIESASDQLFITCNMSLIANLPANPPESYLSIVERGHVWVANLQRPVNHNDVGDDFASANSLPGPHASLPMDEPIAFISIKIFEDSVEEEQGRGQKGKSVFINQVSVDPEYGRKGVGKRLIQHVETWAAAEGFKVLDLTTFADVPFNRPYYERLGYRVLTPEELSHPSTRDLRRTLESEREDSILGKWTRVGMRRILQQSD